MYYYIALMKKWNIVQMSTKRLDNVLTHVTAESFTLKKRNYLSKIQIEHYINMIFYCFVYIKGDCICDTFESFDSIHF